MKNLLLSFALLLTLVCCTTEADRMRMRAGLDSINVRNRSGLPFTVAEVQPYADFFDNHGTPNDRLLAHYLLGRAYSDHGEAPMAFQCYQDAIDCADTTAADCDYAQLARVYGQMAYVFYYQGLYNKMLYYYDKSVKLAWKGKDTLLALRNYEQESFAYMELKDTTSAMAVIEDVVQKYFKLGYTSDAAITLGLNIRPLIDKGEFQSAKQHIEKYESLSGRFDSCGNIEAGREIYYKTKGLYFLKTNKFDSAEYYFRKELQDGNDFYNQNSAANGLTLLYNRLHRPDSMAKYALYAYTMLDSVYTQRTTKEIERMQGMYDYSRHQEEAYKERGKAYQRAIVIWICVGIIIIICLITYNIIRELSHKRQDAEQKYIQSQTAIAQAQHDIANLRLREDVNKELISEKEQIIREQETIMKSLLHCDSNSQSLAERRLRETGIYNRFEQLSIKGQQPTQEEWEGIEQQLFISYPGFKDFLLKHDLSLNDKEHKTCLLIRIGFKPTSISSMLGVTSSYITELRSKMLPKLFGISGSSKSFDKLLKEIY